MRRKPHSDNFADLCSAALAASVSYERAKRNLVDAREELARWLGKASPDKAPREPTKKIGGKRDTHAKLPGGNARAFILSLFNGKPLSWADIRREARKRGLPDGTISGSLANLKKDNKLASVEPGVYRKVQ